MLFKNSWRLLLIDSLKNNNVDNIARRTYENIINSNSTVNGLNNGVDYSDSVNNAIDAAVKSLDDIVNNKKNIQYLKGDLAEIWHTETANISAIAKGSKKEYFIAPRDTSTIDIKGLDALEYLKYQLKYYKTPEDTVKAISDPKYYGMLKLVPSDQLNEIKEVANMLYNKNLNSRPDQAENYLHTYQNAVDMIKAGNIESKPLDEQEAIQIVKEIQKDKFSPENHGLSLSEFIGWKDIAHASGEAAMASAITTMALKLTPELLSILKKVFSDEEIKISDIKRIGAKSIEGGVEGALRGGIAAFITIACRSGKFGTSFIDVNPSVIGVTTALVVNCIKNSFDLYSGNQTSFEYVDNCISDSLILGVGIFGACLGQVLIPIPILGSVIGNITGTILATIVHSGSKIILLKSIENSDFTLFGLVKQDYSLPKEVLEELGIDTVELDTVEIDTIELDPVELDTVDLDQIGFKILKRGFVKEDTVGYFFIN